MASFIYHSEISPSNWEELFKNSPKATVFSTLFYWNSVAKDWYVYTDEQRNFAIPIGVSKKLGIETVYPPFFHRYTEILGDTSKFDKTQFETELKKRFPVGVLNCKTSLLENTPEKTHVYQLLTSETFKRKDQAKRMLKKGEKFGFKVSHSKDIQKLHGLVVGFLSEKLSFYKSNEAERLETLIHAAHKNEKLITLACYHNDQLVGGMFGIKYNGTMLYLKGACSTSATKNGGMYLLMSTLIEESLAENLTFDFGGSRVEGVRHFNTRFNGKDQTYYEYAWNHAPLWYKLLQKIKRWIKK